MQFMMAEQKKIFTVWKEYHMRKKNEKKKENMSVKHFRSRIVGHVFKEWKQIAREWGRERINKWEVTYRQTLITERVVGISQKVEQMMLYMAQLEDKIKCEVQSREQLAIQYQ